MTWCTVYIYLHRSPEDVTSFLLSSVWPEARTIIDRGLATDWHFLRYWHGGPHLRIRFKTTSPAVIDGFVEKMRVAAARSSEDALDLSPERFYEMFDAPRSDWHADGEVTTADYVAEEERYGGPLAMEACERFFGVSSEISLRLLSDVPERSKLLVVAVDLMMMSLQAQGLSDLAAVSASRGYFASWDFTSEGSSAGGKARQAAEASYWSAPNAWDRRRSSVIAACETESGGSTYADWSTSIATLVAQLELIGEDLPLTNSPERIVWSLVHMMNNRLGLSVVDERTIAWLVSLAFPEWDRTTDFFDDSLTAADRTFLEASKYRRPLMSTLQAPKETRPVENERRFSAQSADVVLPAPEKMPSSLRAALSRRESTYGDYGSSMRLTQLASVLQFACGAAPSRTRAVSGREHRFRTHPSASAAYAVDTFVLVFSVEGLRPGAYHYRAFDGVLTPVDTLDDAGLLEEVSPFFAAGVGASARIEASTVPAVIVLAGDMTKLRSRYGLRTSRLLFLEAGHLAQNIGLVAAALDLKSVHISGFDDDALNARMHFDGVSRLAISVLPLGGHTTPDSRLGRKPQPNDEGESHGSQDATNQ